MRHDYLGILLLLHYLFCMEDGGVSSSEFYASSLALTKAAWLPSSRFGLLHENAVFL